MTRTIAIAALLFAGCITPPRPVVPPQSDTDALCRRAIADYAVGLAASFDRAAIAQHADAVTANETLAADNKAARQRAFQPIDNLLNDSIGGDKWDDAKAAAKFRELADGFRKIKP